MTWRRSGSPNGGGDAAGSAAPSASTAPERRRRRGGGRGRAGPARRPVTTTAASASPAAASKATSQPSSISTRSRSVPTTPSTSRAARHRLGPGPGRARRPGPRPVPPSVSRATSADWRARSTGAHRLVGLGASLLGGGQLDHEGLLVGLGRLALDPQALGLGREPVEASSARSAWRWPSRASSATDRSTVASSETQLPADLGRRTRRRRRRAVVVVAHRLAVGGQHRLVGLHLALDRVRASARRVAHLGQLGPQPRRVGLEGGDHARVEQATDVALGGPAPLADDRGQAASPLPELLDASDGVGQVGAAHGREPRLGGRARRCRAEPAWPAARARRWRSRVWSAASDVSLACSAADLAPGEEQPQAVELGHQVAVAAGGLGLALQRPQLAPDLAQEVLQPQQVALGGLEPALGLLLALAELQDTGGLLDDGPPVLGPGVEDGVDLALAHDHVLLAADAAVGQQLLDVEQAARHAVDGVLALAGAEERAGERHLGELDGQQAGRVVDGEAHLGPAEGRRACRCRRR